MTFPAYLPLGPFRLHPHLVFESLGYFTGFQLYRWRRRALGDAISSDTRWRIIVAAAVGALVGSHLLAWLDDLGAGVVASPDAWFGRKSIVGALLGGWMLVELFKQRVGETRSSGDLFALPLCLGIAVGRIGCFLTGLSDGTHGNPTALPWGVDFGDGIRRHPAQL